MTHIIGSVEGYQEDLDKFIKFFNGREYANKNAKVRVRTMIPINFTINECGKEEFLKDLKSFSSYKDKSNKESEDFGGGAKAKLVKLGKWVRRLFPQVKDINKEFEESENSNLRFIEEEKGNYFRLGFYPIGEVKDKYREDGREIVWLKNTYQFRILF